MSLLWRSSTDFPSVNYDSRIPSARRFLRVTGGYLDTSRRSRALPEIPVAFDRPICVLSRSCTHGDGGGLLDLDLAPCALKMAGYSGATAAIRKMRARGKVASPLRLRDADGHLNSTIP